MRRQRSPSSEGGAVLSDGGGQLIEIVKPELKDLSKHWLAALRDHALLGLPSQFAPQLPPDGGAFYSSETLESARPHYRACWPAFLQAASLWLSDEGFHSQPTESHLDQQHRNAGWFHLLLGLSVEALVSPVPEDGSNPVLPSLFSLTELLSTPWPRRSLGSNGSLSIEVLAVVHRVVLTYHKPEHQTLASRILKQVVSSSVECLTNEIAADEKPKLKPASVDDLAVGKSVAFAAMQVAICLLFQRFPSLRLVGLHQRGETQRPRLVRSIPTPDASIASVIEIFPQILSLCDAAASVDILPSILILILKILDDNIGSSCVLLPACVQALQAIMCKQTPEDTDVRQSWLELLRSAYVTLLEVIERQLQTTAQPDVLLYSNILVVLGSVLLSAPDSVTAVEELQKKCCRVFERGIEDPNVQVRKSRSL